MLWDLIQQVGIRRATNSADSAHRSASAAHTGLADVRAEVDALQGTVDRLLLVNRAMWELMAEHTEVTNADLEAKVEEIDLRDGKLDGRLGREISKCPECDRTMSKRHAHCMYCGYAGDRNAFGNR